MNDTRPIPIIDLSAQLARIRPEIDEAVARVLTSTAFVGGPDVGELEREFAAFCGAGHACAVANGTDALQLALRAYGVGAGDEVVTVANTFIATGEAILLAGGRPVFVDVDEATHTMDPARLEAAITARTKVILPVHLYGHPADMTAIGEVAARHGIPVLEDAAQAHGASWQGRRAGALGHAAAFSFYPTKNLGRLRRRRDGHLERRGLRRPRAPDREPRRGHAPLRQRGARNQQPARHAAGRGAARQAAPPRRVERASAPSARRSTRARSRALRV